MSAGREGGATAPNNAGVVGQTLGGNSGTVMIRQQSGAELELGELLVCSWSDTATILQVRELETGSHLDARTMEMISGRMLADGSGGVSIYEPGMTSHILASAKPLLEIVDGRHGKPKHTVPASATVRRAVSGDLPFMGGRGPGRLYLGQVRSGSRVLPGDGLWIDAEAVPRHILVAGATGMGKSNLVKCMLYGLLDTGGVGMLVLDARGEYYPALSLHRRARDGLVCYTPSRRPAPGSIPLTVNVRSVRPDHIRGVMELTEAQEHVMTKAHYRHGARWIERLGQPPEGDSGGSNDRNATRSALYGKVRNALGMDCAGGAFTSAAGVGEGTISDILGRLGAGQVVVVDTSSLGGEEGQTIGNVLVAELLDGRRRAKKREGLDGLPPVGVIIEETPGLLADAGEGNSYYRAVREGRKYKVGVVAVTRQCSMIPREVLAYMGTKIILGSDTSAERDAVVDSAVQDLTGDRRAMASLDVGEAIVSGAFVPFAVPTKIPLVDDLAGNGRAAGRPERPR